MSPHRFGNDVEAPQNNTSSGLRVERAKEGIIGRAGKTTLAKRDREKARRIRQQEKEDRRAQRKADKSNRPPAKDGEDPDLAGLRWGPQAPLY